MYNKILNLPVIALLCLSALASSARAASDAFVADQSNGCKVFRTNLQANENVAWSGQCVGQMAAGQGTAQWSTAGKPTLVFAGTFKNGRLQGNGTMTGASGDRYEGEYKDGMREGKGRYISASGERYEGGYKNNLRDGPGVLTDARGHRTEVVFQAGVMIVQSATAPSVAAAPPAGGSPQPQTPLAANTGTAEVVKLAQTVPAATGDTMVDEGVQLRIEYYEIAYLLQTKQFTPEQYKARQQAYLKRDADYKRRVAGLPAAQQQALWPRLENRFAIVIPPIQQKWDAEARRLTAEASALSEGRAKELETDARTAAQLQVERTFRQRQVQQKTISTQDAATKDTADTAKITALQEKYVGYGANWANTFNQQVQALTAQLVPERERKERFADTTSDIGKDAQRAAQASLAIKRNEMRRANSAIYSARETQENAHFKAELESIAAKYAAGGAMAASAQDFNERMNELIHKVAREKATQWQTEARAEYAVKHPRAAANSVQSFPVRSPQSENTWVLWVLATPIVILMFVYIFRRKETNEKAFGERLVEDAGAVSGERCGQCGTAMNFGASVCGACRAQRTIVAKGVAAGFGGLLWGVGYVPIFAGLFPLFFGEFAWALGLIGIGVALIVVGMNMRAAAPKKVEYWQKW
jgi:hypothetical protein